MNINTFDEYAKNETCPICSNEDLTSFKNENNMKIYMCNTCGGVPSYCNGTLYIANGSIEKFNNSDCMHCGEQRASANTHGYLCKW